MDNESDIFAFVLSRLSFEYCWMESNEGVVVSGGFKSSPTNSCHAGVFWNNPGIRVSFFKCSDTAQKVFAIGLFDNCVC